MPPTAHTVTPLEALRRELKAAKARAALVPGLPRTLELLELHLVAEHAARLELERRLDRLERRPPTFLTGQ